MNLYEFNRLTEFEQLQLVLKKGVSLIDRTEEGQIISLYSIFGFYFEHTLDLKTSKLINVRTFNKLEPLEPYLEGMNLDFE